MTPQQMDQIVRWVIENHRKRGRAVRDGSGRIDWIDPGTRVSLTEVRSYAEENGIILGVNETAAILKALNGALT